MHFLYQFSLQFFLEIFSCVLSANKHLHGITNYANRLSIISTDLFQVVFLSSLPISLLTHMHFVPKPTIGRSCQRCYVFVMFISSGVYAFIQFFAISILHADGFSANVLMFSTQVN